MNDLTKQLKKVEKEFQKKRAELLVKVESDLIVTLKAAQKVLKSIPLDVRANIASGSKVKKLLRFFGVSHAPAKSAPRKSSSQRVLVTDEQILSYLSTERKTKEILEHFNVTAPFITNRVRPLHKAGKVATRRQGRNTFWKAK